MFFLTADHRLGITASQETSSHRFMVLFYFPSSIFLISTTLLLGSIILNLNVFLRIRDTSLIRPSSVYRSHTYSRSETTSNLRRQRKPARYRPRRRVVVAPVSRGERGHAPGATNCARFSPTIARARPYLKDGSREPGGTR